jgi:hypothetical protein
MGVSVGEGEPELAASITGGIDDEVEKFELEVSDSGAPRTHLAAVHAMGCRTTCLWSGNQGAPGQWRIHRPHVRFSIPHPRRGPPDGVKGIVLRGDLK